LAIAARKELRKELRQERTRQERVNPAGLMGGLTSWLQSGVGGALGGGAAGSVVSNGLNELIKGLEQHGSGDAARSWVGNGPNQQVSPNDLAKAADSDTLDALARESGMSRDGAAPTAERRAAANGRQADTAGPRADAGGSFAGGVTCRQDLFVVLKRIARTTTESARRKRNAETIRAR
jgi:uncharacterized protein YidB (DUF937 family)